ncbi:hypothetical protein C8J57DRAFT_1565196 [Mycena rebaudengoi]|nr:hypothetical protein C8J57DRAFT_1565196 [Mycena rebaudengoi]
MGTIMSGNTSTSRTASASTKPRVAVPLPLAPSAYNSLRIRTDSSARNSHVHARPRRGGQEIGGAPPASSPDHPGLPLEAGERRAPASPHCRPPVLPAVGGYRKSPTARRTTPGWAPPMRTPVSRPARRRESRSRHHSSAPTHPPPHTGTLAPRLRPAPSTALHCARLADAGAFHDVSSPSPLAPTITSTSSGIRSSTASTSMARRRRRTTKASRDEAGPSSTHAYPCPPRLSRFPPCAAACIGAVCTRNAWYKQRPLFASPNRTYGPGRAPLRHGRSSRCTPYLAWSVQGSPRGTRQGLKKEEPRESGSG